MVAENAPGRGAQPKENEDWRKNFVRIDQALAATNLIPQLHDLFVQKGRKVNYLALDGSEMSAGFPCTVLTRYIVPVFVDKEEEPGKVLPGLMVSEIFGLGLRTIEIQLGLDVVDLQKIAPRLKSVIEREKEQWEQGQPPPWWTYSYTVSDMTRPYNIAADPGYFRNLEPEKHIPPPLDDALPFECFIWGTAAERDLKLISFVFEQQKGRDKRLQKDPEKEEKAKIKAGLKNLEQIITSYC